MEESIATETPVLHNTMSDGFAATLDEIGVAARTNIRKRGIEVCWGDDRWQLVEDSDTARIRVLQREVCRAWAGQDADGNPKSRPWSVKPSAWQDLWLNHVSQRRVDPFVDWLADLPRWDGTPRIESMLCDLWQVPADALSAWAARAPFVTALARADKPGAEAKAIPVLFSSGQSWGKSALWKHLLPPEHRADWWRDQIDLSMSSKEKAETMAGAVWVEIAEMAGYRAADLGRLKAFLSSTDDGQHRVPWAKYAVSSPRMQALIGTANSSVAHLPRDVSGSDRLIAVTLCAPYEGSVIEFAESHREQMWAEAVEKHMGGCDGWVSPMPDSAVLVLAGIETERHMVDDVMVEKVESVILEPRPLLVMDILDALEVRVSDRSAQHRVREALTVLGWTQDGRSYVAGKRGRWWMPPGGVVEPDDGWPHVKECLRQPVAKGGF